VSVTTQVMLGTVGRQLGASGLVPPGCRGVYAAGSLVKGWGNSESDLDVVVLTDGSMTAGTDAVQVGRGEDTIFVASTEAAGVHCDIEYWSESQVARLVSKVSREALRIPARERQFMIYEINFLDRLGYGVALFGHDRVRYWQEQVHRSAFRDMRAKYYLNESLHYMQDARGQHAAGDLPSATLSTRLAFECAVDALLARYGELGQNAKWRARKVTRAQPSELPFEDYWNVETMRTFDPGRPSTWITETGEVTSRLAAAVDDWLAERR
jgi:predicted nucleotidyltransferase